MSIKRKIFLVAAGWGLACLGWAGCSMPYDKPAPAPPDHLQPPPSSSSSGGTTSPKTQTGNGMDQPAPNGSGYAPATVGSTGQKK